MRKVLFIFCMLCLASSHPAMSQNSPAPTSKSATATKSAKKIKELQEKRDGLQQKISQQEALLRSTKKDVRSQLNDLALITGQIDERKNYIHTIEGDVNILTADIADLQKQLDILEEKLKERKHRYEQSVKYMYRNRTVQDKLMFIFSAKSFSQLYRRMRYVREYAVYQRAQGEIIAEKERQILEKRSELLNVKGAKDNLLQQGVHEQKVLEGKQMEQRKIVDDLKKKQKSLQKELNNQKKNATALDAQIEKLIEKAITNSSNSEKIAAVKKKGKAKTAAAKAKVTEKEKKVAAAKKAEATAKAKVQAAAKKSATERAAAAKEAKKAAAEKKKAEEEALAAEEEAKKAAEEAKRLLDEAVDKDNAEFNAKFERCKGSLPMPITGTYVIVSHFGQYKVEGLKDVVLDSKGIGIKGAAGASVRCVYDGEVTAVFTFNGTISVLVRHGSYISFYNNLASVSVSRGTKIKAREIIGKVGSDGDGNSFLNFQLRKETTKLNPEQWLAR